MNKFLKTIGIVFILITGLRLLSFYTTVDDNDEVFYAKFHQDYAIYSAPLPDELDFAGEPVPFSDPHVYESFDREILVNTYWQSQTVLFLKRSSRYFPVIEPILENYGIPADFKYLPLIESGFMNVISPAGAVGFWQIMESTGKQYGLEISKEVDERYHLEKATHVACKYLLDAKKELGSWTLAAAAYNMGIGGVKKQLKRQKANNYYDLTLNSETSRYVYRIMAVKRILEEPERYGFHVRDKDKYSPIPNHIVSVDTTISNLGDFAVGLGINYRILKNHNPWLRYEYLPKKEGKTYEIVIPEKGYFEILDSNEIETDSIAIDTSLPKVPNPRPIKTHGDLESANEPETEVENPIE